MLGLAVLAALVAAGCRLTDETPLGKAKAEVARNPGAAAYVGLGKEYARAKMPNDAYVAFCTAARLDPSSFDAAYQLAQCLLDLGAPRDGLAWAGRAVVLRPRSAAAHELAGRTLLQAGQPEPAIAQLRRALDLDAGSITARMNLTTAYTMQGDLASALACARTVVDLRPKSSDAHFALADLIEHQGNLPGAEAEFARAVALDARARDARMRLAILHIRQGKEYTAARRLAQEADRLDPGDGTPAALAAWALYHTGERVDAAMELRAVTLAHPYNHYAWVRFAEALRSIGNDKGANLAAARAAVLAPRPARPSG